MLHMFRLLLIGLVGVEARIEGLVTAVFSPFTAAGDLNFSVVPAQQAWLNATGVRWVFVTGTTGESLSLSVSERKRLTDAWISTGTNVIAHVGAESLVDARELATHAENAGAKAIGAMPPTFFKPATAAALASTIASICAAAPKLYAARPAYHRSRIACPKACLWMVHSVTIATSPCAGRPCYYYHIPSMTGVNIPMLEFVQAIEPLSPSFAGIKYTGMYDYPGLMGAQRVLEYKGGKYEVLSGREEMMLEALSIGIRGHVGSQFNIAGDLFNKLIAKFDSDGLTPKSMPSIRALQVRRATHAKPHLHRRLWSGPNEPPCPVNRSRWHVQPPIFLPLPAAHCPLSPCCWAEATSCLNTD